MAAPGWTPPAEEVALGVEFYVTSTAGVAAAIKTTPDDFRVREISAYPRPDPDGPYWVVRVESEGWEQHELADRFAARLGIPRSSIRWAGTKDRRAVAERLFSYRGEAPRDPELSRVRILEAYRSRDPLVLGHHYGNSFEIRLDPVERPISESDLAPTREALRSAGGFANWFGPQRFGEVRPVTHLVGKALVGGRPGDAVDVYLTAPGSGAAPESEGEAARRAFAAHRDANRALREFPPAYRFERALLDHLARGQSAVRALHALPPELRRLFIHAYQSWLFNRFVSERRRAGLSLTSPEPGDSVIRLARDGTFPGRDAVPVTDDNVPECRKLVERGGARLAAPLLGFETGAVEGRPGEIWERLLAEDGVTRDSFRLPSTPELASAGSFRPIWAPLPPIGIRSDPPKGPSEPGRVSLVFSLERGSYATILLREFLKTGARPAPSNRPF